MELREALVYLNENYQKLINTGASILGVAYTPEDHDADFYVVELSLDVDEKVEKGISYYTIYLEGGDIPGDFAGVEESFHDEDINALIKELPDFVKNINYQVYQLEESILGYESAYALKGIFPGLPDHDGDLDDWELAQFREKAIFLISELNALRS